MIIATRKRPESLKRALASVVSQNQHPEIVLVVAEPDDVTIDSTKTVCADFSSSLNVVLIQNRRTSNLSGAINSGIAFLLEHDFNPRETYIAILDDDDTWDFAYLKTCLAAAIEDDYDWIYAGIIRHESLGDPGIELSIPDELKKEDFLVKNPHLQGSSLFVRLISLLRAGCFDEALDSTTDRDLCIRLLDLGNLRILRIPKHLVHHFALAGIDRLSEPDSERKKTGLFRFYLKYAPRMTKTQISDFKERALNLFNVNIDGMQLTESQTKDGFRKRKMVEEDIHLVVGIIATRLQSLLSLLDDLVDMQESKNSISRVVIIDNTGDSQGLMDRLSSTKYSCLNMITRSHAEIDPVLDSAGFGSHTTKEEFANSISGGRSVLHNFLYNESTKIPGSTVWVIDDDIRLSYLSSHGRKEKLNASRITSEIVRLKETGVAVATMRVTGDPPIPGMSTLRTQLLDIYYTLSASEVNSEIKPRFVKNMQSLLFGFNEYYYDYSQSHYSHLELPSYVDLSDKDSFFQILTGRNLTRPSVLPVGNNLKLNFVPMGGSYLVLNRDCLRDFPVISPKMDGVTARRGDTFWGILNRYVRGRIVVQCNLAVQHARDIEDTRSLSLGQLFSDFIGSAFIRAINEYYSQQEESLGKLPARIRLTIDEASRDVIITQFLECLKERRIQYILNAYRIQGIFTALKQLKAFDKNPFRIRELVDRLEESFSDSEIYRFSERLAETDMAELDDFLVCLKSYVKSYRSSFRLTETDDDAFVSYSRRVTSKIVGIEKLEYLGKGREAIVWSKGGYAYKHFRSGWSQFERGHCDFLKKHILQREISKHLVRLEQVLENNGNVVFKVERVSGGPYRGGFLEDIIALIQDCQNENIAISNFHPHNLIISEAGLKFCDIGRSIIPSNNREFLQMAKRAFLTFRFHFREDLDEIMERALYDESIPELFGFDLFLKSLKKLTKAAVLDRTIVEHVKSMKSSSLIDYGCGKGQIGEELAKDGVDVTAYDIDDTLIRKNKQRRSRVRYIDSKELSSLLNSDEKFDYVMCSLVLCTIEDDNEVKQVMSNVRKLLFPDGHALVAICSPFYTSVSESDLHRKTTTINELEYGSKIVYRKQVRETSRTRLDVHRPYGWYEHLFHQYGLKVVDHIETENVDIQRLFPSSDFLVMELEPLSLPKREKVSLIIKASPMEWKTIDFQIRHIVKQLEGPQKFHEKIIVTDRHGGPFLREYDKPNQKRFREVMDSLTSEKIVDRVVYAPSKATAIRSTYRKWFDIESTETHSENGQHLYTTLYGFDQCTGDYVLQADSDCMIFRSDRNHDYLGEMIDVLKRNPNAISVSFNTAHREDRPYTSSSESEKWRIEVRFCLFDRRRLLDRLPLPNSLTADGLFADAWHRALDNLVQSSDLESYRGGSSRTFYIHVPNDRKSNPTDWYNIVKSVERGNIPSIQLDSVDLRGKIADWIEKRNEEMILLVRGRNTPVPFLRRCIDSIKRQKETNWGIILIDACSQNGMDEYIENVLYKDLRGRLSVLRNHTPLPAIQNIFLATREICSNRESVIVHVDADDALIGSNVLTILRDAYRKGADVTVGSMQRLDKQKEYPVDLKDPRSNRGGNVWQHLRSFRKYLFDSIREEDFKINGEWVSIAEDWAFMLPIVEMATKPVHIEEIVYLHEPRTQRSDEMRSFRERIIAQIVRKRRYSPSDIIR